MDFNNNEIEAEIDSDLNKSLKSMQIEESNDDVRPRANESSTQTDYIKKKDAATMTDDYVTKVYTTEVRKYFDEDEIKNLICVFIDSFDQFNSKHFRSFSTIIYLLLRHLDFSFNKIRSILGKFNLMNIQRCHSWA